MNIFKNPPLPSSSKSKKKTAKGLKKCHTLVSSTPYCDNKNKMSNRSCLLESPEGSPIQLDADENVLKTSNLRQLEGNESLEGSSVVYVGAEQGDPDETLKQIATVASPTKNAFKLKSDIPLKRKVVSVKNNRSRSRHSDASTSAQSREDDRKIQTVVSHRSTPRKKKRNETLTDLNHDEQAVISTSASIREISILIPKLSGMMSDSDKAEHRCSTSPSPSRKNEETHATVFRARTRSEKRNESMTVSNGNRTTCDGQLPTPTSTKKAKDMQTSMKPVNFNDGTRSLRKRTCRNTQFIQEVDFEGDKRRLVFVEQTTLVIPTQRKGNSKKRNSSKGNNKKKSRSMLRKTNLPVIDEREVDNDQPGPSSSCLMPPPPVRISTTQHARLQEITADSGFENSNSKTLQVQENTAIRKPKSTPLNLDDDISEPGVLDQEEPVPPTLDDPDINRNLTQSSVIQPPLNDVPIINMQEMTAFSGKQPPWKAYKQSGNLYVYESGNPPDGSIGYIRLKPRTEARSTEPRHHMTFFVIKGTGKIQLESHSHTANLGSGDYCYIPKGRNYTISNPSRCHLVITYKKH